MRKLYERQLGSTWRKWDLHIHSTFSKESSAKLSVEEIFLSAIEKGISVISITDHSNVESLDSAWEIYESTFEKDGEIYHYKDYINFIPGVELKTDKGNKPIHLIALFPQHLNFRGYTEKVDTSFLKTEFLSKLNCTDSNIRAAGEGDYNRGLLSINVNFENASKLARELGGITVVHNGSKSNGFDNGLEHCGIDPTEEQLLATFNYLKTNLMTEYIDICELPSLSKSNLKDKEFYLNQFNKPCIHCSDSHSEFSGEKFTWIKADPTFEGLKQIIFEPRNRIHLGEAPPIEPLYKIDSVKFSFPRGTKLGREDFCLAGENEMIFNPNLTCIIGGRGSGKSTVLNLIHEKLQPSENRFFNNHALELEKGKVISDYITIDNDDDKKHVEFLSQNEIEEFALNQNKFTKAIFSRLKKLDDSSELKNRDLELFKYISEINEVISNTENLKKLREKKENLIKEITTNERLVSSLKDEEYINITTQIKIMDSESQQIDTSKRRLDNILLDLEKILKKNNLKLEPKNIYDENYLKLINLISDEIELNRNYEVFKDIVMRNEDLRQELKLKKYKLEEFLVTRGLIGENIKDVSEANQKINIANNELQELEVELTQLEEEVQSFQYSSRTKTSYEDKISTMLEMLNKDLEELNEHVKTIELEYNFNKEEANDVLLEKVKEKFPKNDIFKPLRNNDIKRYINCIDPVQVDEKETFLDALASIGTQTKTFKALHEFFAIDINFEIYKLLINETYSDVEQFKSINVFYDGKPLENTSFGQRCTAAIVVLLLLGNNPIIIDEPEAHLDSGLIADYLVGLIKSSKLKRQIIFATHNANFVINGDAELIHFLDINNGKTNFSSFTIEDTRNREKLLRLEGGKVAFEQRERRYQFK
ncbi:TrlF family AAA-like ATPase [Rossellomorea oryzaecorticis]|uniref:TrlF family AAA-like ATPase n=1 Tax=Rossellomorea oryzaecorticis TaxID=1396505 RepID=A0ABU9K7I4_9BACI